MTLLTRGTPDFAQVEMTPAPAPPDVPDKKPCPSVAPPRLAGRIEVELPSGVILRVDAGVDATALGCVLAALDRR